MKHVFLFGVLVFSLLAVCNCKNDVNPNYVITNSETGQGKPVPPKGSEAGEGETPEVIPPEGLPPETVPPVIPPVAPPEVVPPVVVTPEDGGDEEGETTQIETPEGETQETEESGTQEAGTEEGEDEEIEADEDEKHEIDLTKTCFLQINELRTEFSSGLKSAEYIEFKVIKGGSMEGLYLYILINDQDTFVYIFPEIDVETGEYITLHLRSLDKNNCFDELRDDLSISGGNDSCPTARDLWVTGNNKLLNKTSIVYLQDVNYKILDAVVMNESPSGTWNNNPVNFTGITERLYKEGMWLSADGNKPTPLDAVNTSAIGVNVYKSVSRYEDRENTHTAKDWYITVAGFFTPGQANK